MTKRPRDWHKVTHERSFTGTMNGQMDLTIREVPASTQAHKLIRRRAKTAAYIKRLIERKFREPSKAADLEKMIRKAEEHYAWQSTKLLLIEKKIEKEEKRQATLKAEMAEAIKQMEKNRAKIRAGKPQPDTGFHPELQAKIDRIWPPKPKKRFAKA